MQEIVARGTGLLPYLNCFFSLFHLTSFLIFYSVGDRVLLQAFGLTQPK